MAYIGNEPGLTNYVFGLDRFNGTGACTQFTLTRTTDDANTLEILVNSVQQDPINSYSVAGGVLTFTAAPSVGSNNIVVIYRATSVISFTNVATAQIADGAVTLSKLASGVLPTANANFAYNHANAAFVTANSASNTATGAFVTANSASNTATAAFVAANAATATDATQNTSITAAFTAANSKASNTATNTWTSNQIFTVANVTSQLAVFGRAFQNIITLTDTSTITMNLAQTNNFSVTLGGNRTLANVTNSTAGQSGFIVIRQDGTGSRTLSFGTGWRFPSNSAPTLTTTAGAVDMIVYTATTTSNVVAQAILSVS